MNNKGQTLALAVLSSFIFLIIGMLTVNFLMHDVSLARNNLNCANAAAISDGTKVLCLVMDASVVYWMVIIFSIVIGLVTARFTE